MLDLFNAQEVFVMNVIIGLQWVGSIRSSTYKQDTSIKLINMLNKKYLV